MTREFLTQVRSLIANASIIGFDIIELTTDKRVINKKVYFKNIFTKKSGAIRHYINNVISICNNLNIDYNEYFTKDKLDWLGILPFDYSQKIFDLQVYNED